MAKTLDYIALSIVLTLIGFVFGAMLFKNIWYALVVATFFSLAIVFSIKYFKRTKYRYNPTKLGTEFAIKGNEYVINLLKTTLKNAYIYSTFNYILLDKCLIGACFKFGTASAQDVLAFGKIAQDNSIKTVFLMSNGIDKKAYQVANAMEFRLKPIRLGALYKYLDKHSALPDLKKTKNKMSLPYILETIFARSNFKAYAFSGTILIMSSFFTPMRTYYIVIGTLLLVLAILSLAFGNGNITTENAFKQLENAVKSDCDFKTYISDASNLSNDTTQDTKDDGPSIDEDSDATD